MEITAPPGWLAEGRGQEKYPENQRPLCSERELKRGTLLEPRWEEAAVVRAPLLCSSKGLSTTERGPATFLHWDRKQSETFMLSKSGGTGGQTPFVSCPSARLSFAVGCLYRDQFGVVD